MRRSGFVESAGFDATAQRVMLVLRNCTIIAMMVAHAGTATADAAAWRVAQARTIRDVTPPGFSRILRSAEGTAPSTGLLFDDVRVNADGSLRAGAITIRLYGLELPPRARICSDTNGGRWACGQRAFVALRNLVERKTISCVPKDAPDSSLMSCAVQSSDIAEALLRGGWAALPDEVREKNLRDAASFARSKRVGLWAAEP